ncbi:MAG: DoxX family protein [Bacteroidota bacterium]
MTTKNILNKALRIIPAVILLQTLFFKFTAAPESVAIFTQLGAEPYGRIGSGVIELIAAILLFIPRYAWLGAAVAFGTISGAILSHLFVLGIEVDGDGGTLFMLAIVVFITSAIVLWQERYDIPIPFVRKMFS